MTVIGLGNEYLSDDGLGILAVRQVADRMRGSDIVFQEVAIGGIELLDHLVGFKRCVVIDAIASGTCPPGTIHRFVRNPGNDAVAISSSHQLDLTQVLALGRLLGADVPDEVTVFGIEAGDITTFHAGPTPEVASAIPALVNAISADILGKPQLPDVIAGAWQVIESDSIH